MRGASRVLLLFCVGVLLGSATPSSAEEAAMVHIRARSQLRLREGERGREKKDGFRFAVFVQLDDNQPADEEKPDKTFAGQRIRLELSSDGVELSRTLIFTDASGAADYRFSGLRPGSYRVIARYDGDDERDRSDAFLDVDLDRQPSQLELEVPPAIGLRERLPIKLSLRSRDKVIAGQVQISVGDKLRKNVQLGENGYRESLTLSPAPSPGALLRVEARFAGDDEIAPTLEQREVQVTTQAHLTLTIAASRANRSDGRTEGAEVPQGGRLSLSGTAFDETGPLIGETIDIEVDSSGEKRRLGSALSDGYGHYELNIAKLQLRPGAVFLSSQVAPRRRHIVPGRSAELPLSVLPPEPVSLLFFIVPLVGTGLALASVLAARALRPRFAAWLEKRRERRKLDGKPAEDLSSSRSQLRASLPTTGEAGVKLGSQRGGLTLRRTVDTAIDGVVADAVFGPTIAGATLELNVESIRATNTDEEGRFVFGQMPAGRYLVRVRAPGYLDEEFPVSIPHRGELRGITVRLMPVRARILAEWQRVAELHYGTSEDLVAKTPQELLLDAERAKPGNKKSGGTPITDLRRLRRLTDLVEQGYYSRRLCTEEMLDEATKLAAQLLRPAPGAATIIAPTGVPSGERDIRAPGAPRPLG